MLIAERIQSYLSASGKRPDDIAIFQLNINPESGQLIDRVYVDTTLVPENERRDSYRLYRYLRAHPDAVVAVDLGSPSKHFDGWDDAGQVQLLGGAPTRPLAFRSYEGRPVYAATVYELSTASPEQLIDALAQFGVTTHPRYRAFQDPVTGYLRTFCNIYVWDVTRAMGAEIPHYELVSTADGTARPVTLAQGDLVVELSSAPIVVRGKPLTFVQALSGRDGYRLRELDANKTLTWLETQGTLAGYRAIDAKLPLDAGRIAQEIANAGYPVVGGYHGQPGHIAVVRPGEYDPEWGPAIAQAGRLNYESGRLPKGEALEYYYHLPVGAKVHVRLDDGQVLVVAHDGIRTEEVSSTSLRSARGALD